MPDVLHCGMRRFADFSVTLPHCGYIAFASFPLFFARVPDLDACAALSGAFLRV
jgi:hypothetical protein